MYTQLMHSDIRQGISGRKDWLLNPPTPFQLVGSDHQRLIKLFADIHNITIPICHKSSSIIPEMSTCYLETSRIGYLRS